ncbi:hypothetical protein BLNAU_808 [Blattamonas nauphoetae]|uniref:Uncharacterized protein n=1 Tax=Blattamonas nauphoetae TaxID=2049346 RepID=A0ABQ9YKI9_9EUKA|nr:hypothetical protein BLNAU_808 [Blattamonas nauphoetae]
MSFYQGLSTFIHLLWCGSPPGQRCSVFSLFIRLLLYGFMCYYLTNLAINVIIELSYVQTLRNSFKLAECQLVEYSTQSITIPYRDNLAQGSCAHFFNVTFAPVASTLSLANHNGFNFPDSHTSTSLMNEDKNVLVSEITYGLCTSSSRKHTHWPTSSSDPAKDKHKCYYNPKSYEEVVLSLPPSSIHSDLLFIILLLIFPTLLIGITLFYFLIKLLRCCIPNLGGEEFAPVNVEEGHGDGVAEEQPQDGLTPAQRQMMAQGWFRPSNQGGGN